MTSDFKEVGEDGNGDSVFQSRADRMFYYFDDDTQDMQQLDPEGQRQWCNIVNGRDPFAHRA